MIHTRDVATRAVAQMLQDQPLTAAKVRFAWDVSVGDAIARVTTITLDRSGSLAVVTETESWRRAIIRSAPTIQRRLVDLLGPGSVRHISVTERRTPR